MSTHGRPGYDSSHGSRGFSALPAGGLGQGLKHYWALQSNGANSVGTGTLTPTSIVFTTGKRGNGALHNLAGSKLTATSVLNPSFNLQTKDFTYVAWVFLPATNFAMSCSLYDQVSGGIGFVQLVSTGSIFQFRDSNAGGNAVSITPNVTGNSWHQIVMTWDHVLQQGNCYIDNGAAFGPSSGHDFTTFPSTFESAGTSTQTGKVNDKADEIGIWDRVFSAADRTAIWNGGAGLFYPY